jgi:hypothetical protein
VGEDGGERDAAVLVPLGDVSGLSQKSEREGEVAKWGGGGAGAGGGREEGGVEL